MKINTKFPFLLSFFFFCIGIHVLIAQSLHSPHLTPVVVTISNNSVEDTYKDGDTLYVAGKFDKVGYQTGRMAKFSFDKSQPLGPYPYIGDGTVSVSASDGNGGWYIGGKFDQAGLEPVSNLIHVLADGTLDSAFTGTSSGWVHALYLDNNTLYIGGDFDSVSGQYQPYLAALDATTGSALSWAPDLDYFVYSIFVDSNFIYVGGIFDHVDGRVQEGFAKFDKSTGQYLRSPSFTYTTYGGTIFDIYSGPNQEIYLGGKYTHGGLITGKSALISTNSDIPDQDHPIIDGTVYASLPDGNGGWFIGGTFSKVGDSSIYNLVHILPGGIIDTSFTPSPNGKVNDLKLDGNFLYIAGEFSYIGPQSRKWLARVDLSTNTLDAWAPQVDDKVNTLEILGNEVLIGGEFVTVNGRPQKGFCRLDKTSGAIKLSRSLRYSAAGGIPSGNAIATYNFETYLGGHFRASEFHTGSGVQLSITSTIPTALTPFLNNEVYDVVSDGSGGWYLGGSFDQINVNGQNFARLIHILPNGELDTAFQQTPDNTVFSLVRDGTTLYIGGIFTSITGQSRNRLAAIDLTSGSLLSWNPDANLDVTELMVEGNLIYIGGSFSQIGGQTRNNLASVDKITGSVTAWNPDPNSSVSSLAYYNGYVYAGGNFSQIGGQTQEYISAIDATTGAPTAWNPGINSSVFALLVDGDSLYVGGSFTDIGGQIRRRVASFDLLNGSLTSWNPNSYGDVYCLTTDGVNIYIGGFFNSIGTQSTKNIVAADKVAGTISATWKPIVDNIVRTIAVDGGKIFLGGDFEYVDMQFRKGLIIFDNLTQELSLFNPEVHNTTIGNGDGIINDILIDSSGQMFLGGDFNYVGTQNRINLAQFDLTNNIIKFWKPIPDGEVFTLAKEGTTVFAGGAFNTISGENRLKLAAFDLSTSFGYLINNWDPAPNSTSTIYTMALSGTDLLVGGSMEHLYSLTQQGISEINANSLRLKGWKSFGGMEVNSIFAKDSLLYLGGDYLRSLNINTGQLTNWNPFNSGDVYAIAGNDSMLIVSGSFGSLMAFDLNTGLIDSTWFINTLGSSVAIRSIEVAGNDILVGGNMQYLGIKDRKNLYSVDLSTNRLTDLKPDINLGLKSIDISGEFLYMGGDFTFVDGQQRYRFAKLNKKTGQVLPGSYNINSTVEIVKADEDKIFLGGNFSYVNTQTSKYLAAIDTAGNVLNWDPDVSSTVKDLHIEGDTLFLAGKFGLVASTSRIGLAAIDKNTGTLFNWNMGLNGYVETIFATPSKLYVGGDFTQIGGKNIERIAAIAKHTTDVFNWNPGASGIVYDIHVVDQHVFYGGNFTSAAGLPVLRFAHVNANTGLPGSLRLRVGSRVYHVNVHDSLLYIGGAFPSVNNATLGLGANFTFPTNAFDPKLDAVVPNVGGNTGTATINVFGSGFENAVSVKLQKAGQPDIEMPDSLLSIIDGIQIVGPVDLQGAALGLWDVSVELADGTILTLPNGFEVQTGVPADLSVHTIGFDVIRIDQWQNYIIDVKNNGLNDAKGVPLWFAVTDNFEVDLSFDIQHPDSMGTLTDTFDQFILIDSLAGEPFSGKLYSLLIPSIAPNTNKLINISLKKTDIVDGKLWAWVKDPWYKDSLVAGVWDCFYLKTDSQAIATGNGPLPSGPNCFYTSAEDYYQYLINSNFVINSSSGGNQVLQEAVSLLGGLGAAIDSCAGGLVARDELLKQLINTKIYTSNTISTEICNPSPPLLSTDKKLIQSVESFDPNDKTGPDKWVNAGEETPYLIRFENVDSATAAAQRVVVLDTLDQDVFDLNSFELGLITVGDQIYSIPPGKKSYSRNIDLRPSQNLILKIDASLNKNTGIARWEFTSLDPATMELTTHPLAGFLPPNVTAPEGEGSVFFIINTKPNLPTNTEITNEAHIYFDNNDVIITDPWINKIDEIKPQSTVKPLPNWTSSASFTVSWDGSDIGAGIEYYDVFVSTNDGNFVPWLLKVNDSSAVFDGMPDSTYSFYSIATDSAGNIEDAPFVPDATTLLVHVRIDDQHPGYEWTYNVYPNPSSGSFYLEIQNPQNEHIHVELFDLQGKKITERTCSQKHQIETFEIGHLSEGIYIIKMQTDNNIKIERIVIKR